MSTETAQTSVLQSPEKFVPPSDTEIAKKDQQW